MRAVLVKKTFLKRFNRRHDKTPKFKRLDDTTTESGRYKASERNLKQKTLMLVHPQFAPIAFSVGPVSVHWYGLMYLVGFALFWWLGTYRAKKDSWRQMDAEKVEDL